MRLWIAFTLFSLALFAAVCSAAPPPVPRPPTAPRVCSCQVSGPCTCGVACQCDDAVTRAKAALALVSVPVSQPASVAVPVVRQAAPVQYTTVCTPTGCYQVPVSQGQPVQYAAPLQYLSGGGGCASGNCGSPAMAQPVRRGIFRR